MSNETVDSKESLAVGTTKPMTLDDAMKNAIAAALLPEALQALVESKISEAVDRWVEDAVGGYNNPVRNAFKDRLQEILVPAIERVNLDNARLDVLLDTLALQNGLGERAKVLDRFGKLVMSNVPDEEVNASDIFVAWTQWVAADYDCEGRSVEFDDGPHYAALDCACELDVHDRPTWSSKSSATLVLEVTDCDEEQGKVFNRAIELWRWDDYPKDADAWFAHYPMAPALKDISCASSFDLYLARLSIHSAKVRWDLGWGDHESVTPDQQPEADWS